MPTLECCSPKRNWKIQRVDWKCERGEHRKNETRQPNGSSIAPITFPLHEEQHNEEDPIWQALAGIQIKISMQKRLNLVPHFWQSIEARVLKTTQPVITANPTESTEGPIVKHHHNPALKLIIKGQGVLGCLIDRGSDVNVISKSTCNRFKIWKSAYFGYEYPTHDRSDLWVLFENSRSWSMDKRSRFRKWSYH